MRFCCKFTAIKFGGDGGNRNRVRKPIPMIFYECSLLFKIPLNARRQAGLLLR